MQDQITTPGLIRSKRSALVALFLTGLVAAMTIRGVLFHPYHHRSRGLFPIFFPLPSWAFYSIQLAFYAWVVWLCFVFFRIARGKERAIVICWSFDILMHPLQTFIPRSAALDIDIDYVRVLVLAVAFFAALDILLRRLSRLTPVSQV